MAEETDPELLRLTRIWRRRFGEPPPILAEAALIRRILESLPGDEDDN